MKLLSRASLIFISVLSLLSHVESFSCKIRVQRGRQQTRDPSGRNVDAIRRSTKRRGCIYQKATADENHCTEEVKSSGTKHLNAVNLPALNRRQLLQSGASLLVAAAATAARAAPPIAIIAEELGYFPVTNKAGETVYIPKRVQRESSDQATELARRLRQQGVVMAGTYWCPHTSRQKELFGREAWQNINYVECSSKGYNGNAGYCLTNKVEGYPTWVFKNGKQISGERPLSLLAQEVGMTNFREELETNLPALPGSACKQ